jgi:hypothetical protein
VNSVLLRAVSASDTLRACAWLLMQAVRRRFGSSVLIAAQDMTFVNLASFLSQ